MMESSLQFISLYAGIYLSTGNCHKGVMNYYPVNWLITIYTKRKKIDLFFRSTGREIFRTFLRQIEKEHLLIEGKI